MPAAHNTETQHLRRTAAATDTASGVSDGLGIAVQHLEAAISQVQRAAVAEIRTGLEIDPHTEAAERDMCSALRQLVLAQREAERREALASSRDRRAIVVRQETSEATSADLENHPMALRELEPPADAF